MSTMTLEQVLDWHREAFKATGQPKHQAMADAIDAEIQRQAQVKSCSLSEALNTLEAWSLQGNTLTGDDVDRFHATADRIAPSKGDGYE